MIPSSFIWRATDILAHTDTGLTSTQIVEYCIDYSLEYDVDIPHDNLPFVDVPNKRTALKENIEAFSPEQQFVIIRDLCESGKFEGNNSVKDLKIKLISRYGALANDDIDEINESLIEETQHWLAEFPDSLKLYNDALVKWSNNVHQRNLLDDIRLALELLLKAVLANNKSMENQQATLGKYISDRHGSKELNNMFLKLVDYFGKYHKTYVKHSDDVNENEIEIIIEIASSFMKFLIKIK